MTWIRPDPGWLSPAPHLGMEGRSHRHRMGLRKLPLDAWLEVDEHAAAQRRIKQALLDERRDEVLLAPETPAAQRATLALHALLAEAVGHADDPAASIERSDPDGVMAACGLLTQEDWCVMVREDTWRLRGACVCFPSRWVLAEKAGGTVAQIHGPVPGYEAQLGGLVESLMDRLEPDLPVWRLNWNLWDDPRLFQPHGPNSARSGDTLPPELVGERVFLRVERQTLRRLTEDGIAFGIRVHQRPLADVARQPGALEVLRATLDGLGDSPSGAKKLGRLAPSIRAWADAMPGS